jgi:uncharacterized protein YjiS (DUF1127 family)
MDRKIMTASTLSKPADVSAFSFVQDAFKGFRRSRLRAAQRKHLLSLDDRTLRDMGLTRLDVLNGDF